MKKHFITGIVILLPLALTIMIVSFVVNFLTKPFVGFVTDFIHSQANIPPKIWIFSTEQFIQYSSQVFILCSLVFATIFIGILTRWFFIHYLISLGEFILHRIPFINQLYKTTQEIIKTIFFSNSKSFKQVVLVPFPTPKVLCIALVTRDLIDDETKHSPHDLVSVFVPTTPNPTSGYLLMYRREDISYLDMKVEDAIKFVFSFGMIVPEGVDLGGLVKKADETDIH